MDKLVRWFRSRISKGEEGAALLIAMLAIVLMTVIGTVVLTVLRNGFINSNAAEAEIQAEMLAQNGLDEALALIYEKVKQANDSATNPYDRSLAARNNLTALFSSTNLNDTITGERPRGNYTVSFKEAGLNAVIHPSANADDKLKSGVIEIPDQADLFPQKPYVHQIIVESRGETRDVQPKRTVTKRMKVYVSTINPVFRYPLSAANDLKLNGAPYIEGDVLVRQGSMINTNIANYYILGNAAHVLQQSTAYPYLQGFYHVLNDAAPIPADQFSSTNTFSDASLEADQDIDVAAYVARAAAYDALGNPTKMNLLKAEGDLYNAAPIEGYFLGSSHGAGTVNNGRNYIEQWLTITGDLNLMGNLVVDNGVLTINNPDSYSVTNITVVGKNGLTDPTHQQGSIYVKYPDPDLVAANLTGKLTLPEDQSIVVEGNTVLNNFTLSGNLFVRGQLKIIGDLKVEKGSIFVDGNVEMKEMKSINQDAAQPVIIATTGTFVMADNMINNYVEALNNQNQLRAFLYSRQNLDLYGVASRLKIIGGVHGKNVQLSAVRGDVTKTGTTIALAPNQMDLPPDKSRLQVIYDENLYLNPPIGIPTTDKVNVFVKEITYPDRYH